MKDFLIAAAPWIVLALSILGVIIIAHSVNSKRKTSTQNPSLLDTSKKPANDEEKNYVSEGMSVGMCIGVAIGTALMDRLGSIALCYGISLGMLVGAALGACKKK